MCSNLILSLALALLTTTIEAFKSFHQYPSWKITGDPQHSLEADSKFQCILACDDNPICMAVHYNLGTKQCLQFNRKIFGVSRIDVTSDDYVVYVREVHSLHVYGTAYNIFTYTGAQHACKELGGRLMTSQELYNLYLAGEQYCSCSWIEGGSKKFIMQTRHWACYNSIGMLDCSVDWGTCQAWCTIDIYS